MTEILKEQRCCSCKKILPLDNFYRQKRRLCGRNTMCKECHYVYGKQKNQKERKNKWRRENKDRSNSSCQVWAKKNLEKQKAHWKLHWQIKKGNIRRQPCIICGETRSNGHHEDYSKPLEVIWLCHEHHRALHTNKLNIENYDKTNT